MNISVAIRTIFADDGEHRLNVTLNAFHFFVQSAQGIFRFVVIEFGNRANRTPTRGSVAILAGNIERPMGISSGLILRRRKRSRQRSGGRARASGRCRDAKKSPERELEQRERGSLPRRG